MTHLVDPVGVEDAEAPEALAGPLLGLRLEVALELELVDTLVLGLTVHDTLAVRALAATAADGHTVHDVALPPHNKTSRSALSLITVADTADKPTV